MININNCGALRAAMPATRNAYTPLDGFYGAPMYHWVIDDYGNAVVTVWPMLDLLDG